MRVSKRMQGGFALAFIALAVLVMLVYILFTGLQSRHQTDHRKRACYARGAQYHYWQDRSQCVLYVDLKERP